VGPTPVPSLSWEKGRDHSPAIPSGATDDGTKIDRLLGDIAAQSHFEDRYELRGILARGGMGEVHHGYDRILQREVAIKMRRAGSAGESAALRGQFLKEARVGGRLLHPNILPVFDLGVNRAQQIFYTMRLVNGQSLQHTLDALDKGVSTRLIAYPLPEIVRAFVGACEGMDYAHQNGVLHLDLKPHNVLVSGFREVFVIDWGLARVDEVNDAEQLIDLYRERASQGNTGSNTNVHGGRAIGTPDYMAPEQVAGAYDDYSAATDVFALGGILYFILYGVAPNRRLGVGGCVSATFEAAFEPKTRRKLRQGILPRGQRISKEVQEAVEALEAICLKALEVEQKDRYSDVEQLIVELNEWLTGEAGPAEATSVRASASSRSGTDPNQTRRWWQFWKRGPT
jgi:serine/threonine-protein kinase